MPEKPLAEKKRSFALDFIRLLAMLSVFLFHLNLYYTGSDTVVKIPLHLGRNITLGVFGSVLFFILSGYTSAMSYQPGEKAVRRYYKKRALSIFPMFYIAYLIAFLFVNFPAGQYGKRLLFTLLGMDGYLQMYGIGTYHLVGEWFLGCVLLLYLFFPLLELGARKSPIPLAAGALLLKAAACILVLRGIIPETDVLFFMPDFAAGILLGKRRDRIPHAVGAVSGAVLLLLVLIPFPKPFEYALISLTGVSGFLFLLYLGQLLEAPQGGFVSMIRKAVTVTAGYSFAAFLVHHVVMGQVYQGLSKYSPGLGQYLLFLAVSLLFTAAFALIVQTAARAVTARLRR